MRVTTLHSYQERLLRVQLFIEQHLDENLQLETLAEEAHMSSHHFHRIFTGMLGESVKTYVRRLRMERAALRLTHGKQPVTEIAFDAGYETMEAFSRAFKRMFEMSPTNYRGNSRKRVPGFVLKPNTEIRKPTGEKIMDVRIEELPLQRVAFARHVGQYADCHHAWEKICSWAGARGLLNDSTLFLGICHDDPEVTAAENIRYDACVTLDQKVAPEGDIGIQEIWGGAYAIATHKGPFDTLQDSYNWLCGHWLPSNGKEIKSAPSVEIYLNDPDTTPPEELLVDICIPLES